MSWIKVGHKPKKRPADPEIQATLTAEQEMAVDLVLRMRKSILLSGPAGTGKSAVLRQLAAQLSAPKLALTAATGVAATQLERGTTIHQWSGLGVSLDAGEALLSRAAQERWQQVDILVIDEVSMISRAFFEALHQVASAARKLLTLPFGGVVLLLVGDFCQLGPIHESSYCFLSPLWEKTIYKQVLLTKSVSTVQHGVCRSLE